MQKFSQKFVFTDLEEKGRLQFFYHSPSSGLPIRDVLNEQGKDHKTEPHIEIGAENFINPCYQKNNILPFLRSSEKYLFLFTSCRSKKLKSHVGRRFIVGYITKQNVIDCGDHYAVRGKTKLYSFADAYPLEQLFPTTYKNIRIKKLPSEETKRLLNHFKIKRDILFECVREIERLDEKNTKENKTCKILKGENCELREKCLRWK